MRRALDPIDSSSGLVALPGVENRPKVNMKNTHIYMRVPSNCV